MDCAERISAFTAFELQLKSLHLQEFPCGVGSWSENCGKSRRQMKRDQQLTKQPITLKDYGVSHEKTETLEEYLSAKKSPWHFDFSWSKEAEELRQIAIRSPWLVDNKFILNHFKTLRIADKGVEEIDEHLLKFGNLEELSLSANKLQIANSNNLPRHLKVLELCANEIVTLLHLCVSPPPLLHLGLGYNRLAALDGCMTGKYWPHLLSLDLSHNDLAQLTETSKTIRTLPKLRNLILQGNPLALVPGYRGYMIDTLPDLSYLDDVIISADEKHHYRGLSDKTEYILDEAKLLFSVSDIKGIPVPEEISDPDDQPEYPKVVRKYYVQFMFIKKEQHTILDSSSRVSPSPTQEHKTDIDTVQNEDGNSTRTSTAQTMHSKTPDRTGTSCSGKSELGNPSFAFDAINSASFDWQEEITLDWEQQVTRSNLLELRNFLEEVMAINVVEEKILSYPPDQMPGDSCSPTTSPNKGKEKKGKKEKVAIKEEKKDERKKDKKKKEADIELVSMPPQVTNIATFEMDLSTFVRGGFQIEKTFSLDFETVDKGPESDNPQGNNQKQEDKRKDKKKPTSARKADDRGKKDKGKDKGNKYKKTGQLQVEDEDAAAPPPLVLNVLVKLHHWKTAADL